MQMVELLGGETTIWANLKLEKIVLVWSWIVFPEFEKAYDLKVYLLV